MEESYKCDPYRDRGACGAEMSSEDKYKGVAYISGHPRQVLTCSSCGRRWPLIAKGGNLLILSYEPPLPPA